MEILKNKVVALGVVYPGVEDYLDDYFASLGNQTYNNYDIWIFNDGLDKSLLKTYMNRYGMLNIYIEDINSHYTPAEIREMAILKIKEKYDYLIFTDTDDYISQNRIEKSIDILQTYHFCYNNMILVNCRGEKIYDNTYFTNKDNPMVVSDYKQLLKKNFCGLANTAINLKTTNLDFLNIPSNIVAVDWWLFSLLLIKGYKGYFLEDVYTYYRQYDQNTVGGIGKLNVIELAKGIKIKKKQYRSLLKYYPSEFDFYIKKELNNILLLEELIKEGTYSERYVIDQNNKNKEFMWWENIELEKRW